MQVIPKSLFILWGIVFFYSSSISAKAKIIYTGTDFYYTYDKSKKVLSAFEIKSEDQVARIKLDDLEKSAGIFGNNMIKNVSDSTKMRVAFFNNLLFDQKEKMYLAFSVKYPSSYLLYMVEFDKASMIFRKRKIPSPRPSYEDLPFNAADYAQVGNCIFENYLFQVYVQEDLFMLEIKSLDETNPKKVIKRYTFQKDEVINFRNSPIMEETNIDHGFMPKFLNKKRLLGDEPVKEEVEDKWLNIFYWEPLKPAHSREILSKDEEKTSTKFLRISAQRNVGILVKRVGEQSLELSIGNYEYRNKKGDAFTTFNGPFTSAPNRSVMERAMIFISYLSLPDFSHIDNDTLEEKGFE